MYSRIRAGVRLASIKNSNRSLTRSFHADRKSVFPTFNFGNGERKAFKQSTGMNSGLILFGIGAATLTV